MSGLLDRPTLSSRAERSGVEGPPQSRASSRNALSQWLRFAPERVAAVEDAYDAFVDQSCIGVFFSLSIVATVVAMVAIAWSLRASGSRTVPPVDIAVVMIVFYGVQALALLRVRRSTFAAMFAGAIDPARGVIFGIACGAAAAVVETALVILLVVLHVHPPKAIDVFATGVIFGLFFLLIVAPFVEEFLMQGWLQTRLRGAGGVWAGALTTVAFALLHIPTNPFALVRTVVLGGAAAARGTSRSLGMAVAMHLTNNLCIGIILLVDRLATHHR